jgi:ATP-binding cassette subfamily B protein
MSTEINWETHAWPVTRLGELVENLALRSGLIPRPGELSQPPEFVTEASEETIGRWIDVAAGHLGLEAEGITSQYAELEVMLQNSPPVIIRLPGPNGSRKPQYLGIVKGGNRRVSVLGQDLRSRKVKVEFIQNALAHPYEEGLEDDIEHLIHEAEVPERRMKRVRKAILREQLGSTSIQCGWLLRTTPGVSLWTQFRQLRIPRPALILGVMYFIQILLTIATWFVLGRGIFQGYFDWGWLLAWAILLFATIPVQMAINDSQSELSVRLGVIFKFRLLDGTLKLEPDEIRHQGMGGFLGRVMESEAVEMLGFNGGLLAILSIFELIIAVIILSQGAGGAIQAALLVVWTLIVLVILWRYYLASKEWTVAYREMTNDLVERMVGHRTRLVQEDHRHWHEEEDQSLDRYLKLSENLDRIGLQLNSISTRGWILVGFASLAIPYVTGSASVQLMAISLGGILLAAQGLSKLAGGAQSLVGLFLAWGQVGPIFEAASRPREVQPLEFVLEHGKDNGAGDLNSDPNSSHAEGQTLLLARDITFSYRPTGKPVIEDGNLKIQQGERYLLEGPSGGGKTTLAALLTGLRNPQSGSLMLWGYDRLCGHGASVPGEPHLLRHAGV